MNREIKKVNGRELKFRAWDTIDKKMRPVVMFMIGFGATAFSVDENGCDVGTEDVFRHVMQYTGLKDRLGKDIYEGDVVKYLCPMFEEERIDSISFGDGTFRLAKNKWWKDGEYDWYSLEQVWYEEIEVIGNIWENPELIVT